MHTTVLHCIERGKVCSKHYLKMLTLNSNKHSILSPALGDYRSCPALLCVYDMSVLPRGISDHAPLCLSLALTVPPRVPPLAIVQVLGIRGTVAGAYDRLYM